MFRALLIVSLASFTACHSEPAGDPGPQPAPPAPKTAKPAIAIDARQPAPAQLVWLRDEQSALAEAKKGNKRILIDVSAVWCAPCKELEEITFADAGVRQRLSDYVLLKLDVSEQTDHDLGLQEKYKAATLPVVLVLGADGGELLRITKFVSPQQFSAALDELPAG